MIAVTWMIMQCAGNIKPCDIVMNSNPGLKAENPRDDNNCASDKRIQCLSNCGPSGDVKF